MDRDCSHFILQDKGMERRDPRTQSRTDKGGRREEAGEDVQTYGKGAFQMKMK
jgi:hypothetical protein